MTQPATPPSSPENLLDQLEHALPEVRPALQQEGGDLELVGIDADRIVQVRLLGACQGCSSAVYTWTLQVEQLLRDRVPAIRFVEAVP